MSMAGAAMPSALPANPPSTLAAPLPASPKLMTAPAAPVSAPVAPFPSPVTPSRLTLAPIPVSATLAANEALARKRRAGETVLPLAFGEAGLPAHPLLTRALAEASAGNTYGPVAGLPGAARGRGRVLDPPRHAHRRGQRGLRPGQQGAAVRAAAGHRHGRGRAPAQLGQLRRASQHAGVTPHFVPVPPGEGGSATPRPWPPR